MNSGLSTWSADEDTAAGLHAMAAASYPFLGQLRPKDFTRLLATGEIALGSALLLPRVSTAVAGAGLTVFSAGLLGMYARTAGLRREGGLRSTEKGIPMAKDAWLLGIGLGLLIDSLTDRS